MVTGTSNFLRYLSLLFMILINSSVSAGAQTGKIDSIIVRAIDGLVWFTMSGEAKTNSPPCATIDYWMIRDEKSQVGQQQYSLILTAYAGGKEVKVVGMGSCDRWGDGEDVNWIQVL